MDISERDWPGIKNVLNYWLYAHDEPIPVTAVDLAELVRSKPTGPVVTKLLWNKLNGSDFEALIYALLCSEPKTYENPSWLMQSNAPDRGRDLSAERIHIDQLGGTIRERVFIQCKHWQTKSIGLPDITLMVSQTKLWDVPRVDVLVIATSGRFTTDAVDWIEKYNRSDTALRIEMWPDSHLERLLASRPSLIAEFGLR